MNIGASFTFSTVTEKPWVALRPPLSVTRSVTGWLPTSAFPGLQLT